MQRSLMESVPCFGLARLGQYASLCTPLRVARAPDRHGAGLPAPTARGLFGGQCVLTDGNGMAEQKMLSGSYCRLALMSRSTLLPWLFAARSGFPPPRRFGYPPGSAMAPKAS